MLLSPAVLLDLATFDRDDIDLAPLCAACPDWTLHRATTPGETAARLAGMQVAVTNKVVLDRGVLAASPALRLVCIAATGTNNVDLAAASELGIAVTNVTGYATPAVVQHVFAVMLAHATRLRDYDRVVREGAWAHADQFCLLGFPIRELAGRTLGIVGFGALGQGVARAAEAFGMRVLVAGRPGGKPRPGRVPLDDLLARSDVVTLHVPLAENTRNLIGPAELARMKPDALLINTARGGIVDEAALAAALCAGTIGGAAVDVLSVEPPRDGNPLLAPGVPNLILTPHVAWGSREARQRLVGEVAENIAAFAAGRVRNRVA